MNYKSMKKIVILLPILLFLISCELFYSPTADIEVYHIAIALNYVGTDVGTLRGTLNDASALHQTLLGRSTQYSGILMLQDGSDDLSDPLLPTKEHVLDHIGTVIASLSSKDLLIVTYSGHGVSDGSWVLFPTDADKKIFNADNKTPKQEVLLHPDELFAALSSFKGTILLIVDSCYAGNFVQESNTSISLVHPRESYEEAYRRFFSKEDYIGKVFVMAATTRDNTSKEPVGGNPVHGFFTKALLEGLGWDVAQQKLIEIRHGIGIDDLYRYVLEHQAFPLEGTNTELYQHPLISPGPMELILP